LDVNTCVNVCTTLLEAVTLYSNVKGATPVKLALNIKQLSWQRSVVVAVKVTAGKGFKVTNTLSVLEPQPAEVTVTV
jgi:hypothetical protein